MRGLTQIRERMRNVQLVEVLGLNERAAEGLMGDGDHLLTRRPGVKPN